MFHLRAYSTPRHPHAWQYRAHPAWLVWEWKPGSWHLSLDPEAPVSTQDLIQAIEDDDYHRLSRQKFASRKEAVRSLNRCVRRAQG